MFSIFSRRSWRKVKVELLIEAENVVTPVGKEPLRGKKMELEVLEKVYIVVNEGKIADIAESDSPYDPLFKLKAKLVLPGLVDPHTHIPFYGYREEEFVMRAQGASYLEILEKGGGIINTMGKVRKAGIGDLVSFNRKFLDEMLKKGVTTLEGKSGYGLRKKDEIKQLKVLKILDELHPIDVFSTFLGAHAFPKDRMKDEYMEELMDMLGDARKYTDVVDIFCDKGVFTPDIARGFLEKAKKMGFKIRMHADELENVGATKLAIELGAISVDHVLKIGDEEIELLSESNTIVVLMPGTSYFLNESFARARDLIDSGAIVALASDFNPGSCPINDPSLIMNLAVLKLKMTPEEAIVAYTLNSSAVLGVAHDRGSIEIGKRADLVLYDLPSYNAIPYLPSHDVVRAVVKDGKVVYKK